MAALDGGKSTGSAASLDAVMDVVSKHIPSWDIAYLCEVDAFGYEHELFSSSAHSVHRHYPGLGSWAMALVVHQRIENLLRYITKRGRCIAGYLCQRLQSESGASESWRLSRRWQ